MTSALIVAAGSASRMGFDKLLARLDGEPVILRTLRAFEACQDGAESCAISGCPGTAVGWRSTARSKRWTVNI